jgi:hypothetical protein
MDEKTQSKKQGLDENSSRPFIMLEILFKD